MGLRSFLVEWTPFAAMVIVEFLDVGLATLSKAAMSRGMSHFVFVVYSNALATLILLPSSFIINRSKLLSLSPLFLFTNTIKFFSSCLQKINKTPPFFLPSLQILPPWPCWICSITVMQNCVFTGISYSSPTLGSAMSNLTPAITFVLAVIFRMEKLDIGSSISQIKIMGTVLSISGALLVTLYKGTPIGSFRIEPSPSQPSPSMLAEISSWVIGGIFLAIASLSLAVWNIAQAAILKGYPSQLTIVAFYCLFGTIQCAILSVIVVRDSNAWNLKPDIELISILYSATFGSVVTFSVLTWCINRKGPVFVTMFKPVGIAIAAFMSVVFLVSLAH
ncbi:WAT1-related protein At5g40230-like isoform X3 [Gastrolobium bilobum]|uniref:WAT1-related protein At5g40230-like isoform X3 n=1 Tax=Gastrolobium bilobum TaxID=150636 RepID=UPI002AB21B0A|nr:WAT1-related protein At5g40230-like isoform X3 [Gastrolobium bilobum]